MSNNEIKTLQKNIEDILDILDQTDDPVVKERLLKSAKRHTERLKKLEANSEQEKQAVDVLDRCLEKLVYAHTETMKIKAELNKLKMETIRDSLSGGE